MLIVRCPWLALRPTVFSLPPGVVAEAVRCQGFLLRHRVAMKHSSRGPRPRKMDSPKTTTDLSVGHRTIAGGVPPLRGCRKEGNALIPWAFAHGYCLSTAMRCRQSATQKTRFFMGNTATARSAAPRCSRMTALRSPWIATLRLTPPPTDAPQSVGTHGRCVLNRTPLRYGFRDCSGTKVHWPCDPTGYMAEGVPRSCNTIICNLFKGGQSDLLRRRCGAIGKFRYICRNSERNVPVA